MTAPLVAITGWCRRLDGLERAGVNAGYVRSVARAGGIPLVVPPSQAAGPVAALLDRVDALVLTGGADIDPRHYGQTPSPRLQRPDPARDELELALLRGARDRGIPVLGVCRGLQLINVGLGGTLWQDLPSERPGAVNHDPDQPRDARVHTVRVQPDSLLCDIIGTTSLETNSIHHQAIRDLAPSLRETAWADDGVIEGIEARDSAGWLVGVQWHPEEFAAQPDAADQRVFASLVQAAGERRGLSAVPGRPPRWERAPGRSPG